MNIYYIAVLAYIVSSSSFLIFPAKDKKTEKIHAALNLLNAGCLFCATIIHMLK